MSKGVLGRVLRVTNDISGGAPGAHGSAGEEETGHARGDHRGPDEGVAQIVRGEALQTSPKALVPIPNVGWGDM